MSQKKKSTKQQQDQTTLKIPNMYKKKCQQNGIVMNKAIREKLDNAIQDGKFQVLQMWDDMGPIQIRALMESLSDLNYQHLKKIRLWKMGIQNQGLRSICNYIQKCNCLEYVDLMDNHITQLGCQFLSRVLANQNNKIIKLKLDNNPIKSQGLRQLALGLQQNTKIQKLSFNYCEIDSSGVKYIQQIMANIDCKLRSLKLQGNHLGNDGAYQLLRSVAICGEKLQKLNIADIGLNLLGYKIQIGSTIQQKIAKQLFTIIETNTNIAKYNLKNNFIPDELVRIILSLVKQNKNIFIIDLPQGIAHELKQYHAQIMKKRKPKKKKKKGKGVKKGKK